MASEPEKTVTNIAIRGAYDSVRETLGPRACAIVFKNAGLDRVIECPPDYTLDKSFTLVEQVSVYKEVLNLVGSVGGQGILRQIGYTGTKTSILTFGVLNHLADLPANEKIVKGFEFFQIVVNKGKVGLDPAGCRCTTSSTA